MNSDDRSLELHLEVETKVNYTTMGGVARSWRLTLYLQVLKIIRQRHIVDAPLFLLVPVYIVHGILALAKQWLQLYQLLNDLHPKRIMLVKLQIESVIFICAVHQENQELLFAEGIILIRAKSKRIVLYLVLGVNRCGVDLHLVINIATVVKLFKAGSRQLI